MTHPKEAVEAVARALRDAHGSRLWETWGDEAAALLDQIAPMLTTRADAGALGAVVKPLVWEDDKDANSETFGCKVAVAPSVNLRYIIRRIYGGRWKLSGSVPFAMPEYATLEAAQAAVQSGYETLIRATLAGGAA